MYNFNAIAIEDCRLRVGRIWKFARREYIDSYACNLMTVETYCKKTHLDVYISSYGIDCIELSYKRYHRNKYNACCAYDAIESVETLFNDHV